MRLQYYIFLTFSLISGCGTDESKFNQPSEDGKDLRFASEQELSEHEVAPHSYLVAFKTHEKGSSSFRHFSLESRAHSNALSFFSEQEPGIKEVRFLSSLNLADPQQSFSSEPTSQISAPKNLQLNWNPQTDESYLASLVQMDFLDEASAQNKIRRWHEQGRIWYAEPNYRSELNALGIWADYKKIYEESVSGYWHNSIKTTAAFDILEANSNSVDDEPIIAVMDSGIDVEHPAIQERLWKNQNPGEAGCGSDDFYGCDTTRGGRGFLGTGNVAPAMTEGYNQACPQNSKGRCEGNCCHGTHVAGIIASVPYQGSAGVCPTCRIMAIKIVGQSSEEFGSKSYKILDGWIAAGLRYVAAFKKGSPVRVINASFGKFQRSRSVAVLINALFETSGSSGTILVGAAGNDDTLKMQYPAGYPDAIAVSNVGTNNIKHFSSSFGSWVDISAPGTEISSSVPGGSKETLTGTSMAAPMVAGIAGLILANKPDISTASLRDAIINSADPSFYTSDLNKNYLVKIPGEPTSIPLLGSGVADASKAVEQASSPNQPSVRPLDRVTEGCGVIGGVKKQFALIWFCLIGLPIFMKFLRHASKKTKS